MFVLYCILYNPKSVPKILGILQSIYTAWQGVKQQLISERQTGPVRFKPWKEQTEASRGQMACQEDKLESATPYVYVVQPAELGKRDATQEKLICTHFKRKVERRRIEDPRSVSPLSSASTCVARSLTAYPPWCSQAPTKRKRMSPSQISS